MNTEVLSRDPEIRARGCTKPIRLVGSTTRLNTTTGEFSSYSSADEPDGYTYVRCGNRRASACPSCSHEYKGDAWHLLSAGMAGGKTVPDTVATHPATFVTLTAPSFGYVHGRRDRGGLCRPRRDRPTCEHGRPLYCLARHDHTDPRLGDPLCPDCYDYASHVLWQWHAPELWRRFTINLTRTLAATVGVSRKDWGRLARISYTKVTEFQARGVIHVHAVIRLDGPQGPDSTPLVAIDAHELGDAATTAAQSVQLVVTPDYHRPVRLRWGAQVNVRPVTTQADRDKRTALAHPEQVAAYLAKYLTKSTEDFGINGRIRSVQEAVLANATDHAVRIIATAARLARISGPTYHRLHDRYATLGYRGHPITKTRTWSTTFGALRAARRTWRQRRYTAADLEAVRDLPDDTDPDSDDTTVIVRDWTYAGTGYTHLPAADLAIATAARTKTR